ncbi:hypothetical protein BU25DRAFT_494675 [Macroventuria anomochaeta]|uniref:Uncharacterized protein n=1 Tax=Macroventuria anomochaeta TaxID=301207 RepID=A0ACB6RQ45_9PLEO|nr:uncharacterized protein BU25DRAFT_494675 [Macroventuria anomochaeta]KAF2623034.1 hypothetical protein BU25DRAFT_494675 [Macroventuria anomochaeta]
MEANYASQPNSLTSAHAGGYATTTAPLDGVFSLDEFLSNNQAIHDALVAAREAAETPPAKKSKKSNNASQPQPVVVGARSSKYTILLHEKYQALAIPQPVFTFGGDSVTRWTVEISFPGLANADELQGLKEEGRFNSKQEAKNAASKTALTILERLEQEGRVTKAGKTKKPNGEPAQQQPKQKEEPDENFVGQLLEFQRSTSAPHPTYTDWQLGTRWACTLEIEGHDQPFGSQDALFGSKKLARQYAASCAVFHFKSQGLWPEEFTNVGGIRKRKPAANNSPSPCADGRKANVASSTGGASAASQAAALAHLLNLNTPEYRYTHEKPSVPDVHTVSCFFRNGGAHEGPIGEVRNVFGKKKAKEECARLTLGYLTEVKRQREEVAARLMVGIAGGAGVVKKKVSDDELDIYKDDMEH